MLAHRRQVDDRKEGGAAPCGRRTTGLPLGTPPGPAPPDRKLMGVPQRVHAGRGDAGPGARARAQTHLAAAAQQLGVHGHRGRPGRQAARPPGAQAEQAHQVRVVRVHRLRQPRGVDARVRARHAVADVPARPRGAWLDRALDNAPCGRRRPRPRGPHLTCPTMWPLAFWLFTSPARGTKHSGGRCGRARDAGAQARPGRLRARRRGQRAGSPGAHPSTGRCPSTR